MTKRIYRSISPRKVDHNQSKWTRNHASSLHQKFRTKMKESSPRNALSRGSLLNHWIRKISLLMRTNTTICLKPRDLQPLSMSFKLRKSILSTLRKMRKEWLHQANLFHFKALSSNKRAIIHHKSSKNSRSKTNL